MTTGPDRSPLRFASFLAPNLLPTYRFLAQRITHHLGHPVQVVVGASFDQFEHGQADLGVICGLPHVWLAARRPRPVEPLAAPVLAGERYAGRPVYYSDVIVHRDSPITRIPQLQGRSWAYNEPASRCGHTVTLYELVRIGARPGFFSSVVEAGFHQRAIWLVARGRVDAAAIDSQVLAIELRDHPRLAANLRVIGTFGPSTIQPVVATSHLPDQLKPLSGTCCWGSVGTRRRSPRWHGTSSRASSRSATGTTTASGPCWTHPRRRLHHPPRARPPADGEVAPAHRIHAAVASG